VLYVINPFIPFLWVALQDTVGSCDWSAIRAIRQAVSIPVIANGGIATSDDAARCLEETGVDAVMSCEAVLENPGLFASEELKKSAPRPFDTVLMYLDLAEKYHSCQPKAARAHIFKFLFGKTNQLCLFAYFLRTTKHKKIGMSRLCVPLPRNSKHCMKMDGAQTVHVTRLRVRHGTIVIATINPGTQL